MRERREREDQALAEVAVNFLGPWMFTERELANRVRLLARKGNDEVQVDARDPSLAHFFQSPLAPMIEKIRAEI